MELGNDERIRWEEDGPVVLFAPGHPLAPAAVSCALAALTAMALLAGIPAGLVALLGVITGVYTWFLLFELPQQQVELRVRGAELSVTGTGWSRRKTFRAPLSQVQLEIGESWLELATPDQRLRLHASGWYRSDLRRLVEQVEAEQRRMSEEQVEPVPEALQALRQRS